MELDNIALAFSGGGFRAACFSLGGLSYLHHVKYGSSGEPLLKNVKFISSTSGGSITNLVYSASVFKGQDFTTFYNYLRAHLDGEAILAKAIKTLTSRDDWKGREDKTRNLINAFSIVYDLLLDKETFSLFSDRSKNPHIEEICINSTEFTNGLPFRFQSQHPNLTCLNGHIGNYYIYFDKTKLDIPGRIKLADILAASSCFPSGFEPIIFPEDFTHEHLTAQQLRDAINYTANTFTLRQMQKIQPPPLQATASGSAGGVPVVKDGNQPLTRLMKYGNPDLLKDDEFLAKLHIGMMDGGVDDNQGIDAFEKAYERRSACGLPQFDLFIACDVTSNFMDGYTLPLERKGLFSNIRAWVPLLACLLIALYLPYTVFLGSDKWSGSRYIMATISGILDLPLLYLMYLGVKGLLSKKSSSDPFGQMLKKYGVCFLLLRLGTLKQMLTSRIKSVFLLANDIYLKQIRRMYYRDLFDFDPRFKGKVIQNAIYDLSKVKFSATPPPTGPQPSATMIDMAETARLMGTTLWFDPTNMQTDTMKQIIVTGQFTMCYNLLKHVGNLPENAITPELQLLKISLQADWDAFCKQADILY